MFAVQVNEYDCLLLEFVFGNRPDDAQKVRAYILETIGIRPWAAADRAGVPGPVWPLLPHP